MKKITPDYESTLKDLSPGQINELEMHSFLNLVNVIYSLLELLIMDGRQNTYLAEALQLTKGLTDETRKGKVDIFFPEHVREYKNVIRRTLHSLEKQALDEAERSEVRDARALLDYVFSVLDARLRELYDRIPAPDQWQHFTIDEIKKEYEEFFFTLEKNSNNRYRIVKNIACKEKNDYLVHLDIDNTDSSTIDMPLLFKDVIRDLISNARKYTHPGGTIQAGIRQHTGILRFVVADNGIGIPEEELPLVFEYAYRASNVGEIRTMGGGFGLTKALHVVQQFKGDMWIESELGKGTKIVIELPVPEGVQQPIHGASHEKKI